MYCGVAGEWQRYSGARNSLKVVWNPTTILYPATSAGNPFLVESFFTRLGLFLHGSGPFPPLRGSKFSGRICGFSGELPKCLKLKVLTDACRKVYACDWGSGFKGARARDANWFRPRDSVERSPALTPFREGQSRGPWHVKGGRFSDHRGLCVLASLQGTTTFLENRVAHSWARWTDSNASRMKLGAGDSSRRSFRFLQFFASTSRNPPDPAPSLLLDFGSSLVTEIVSACSQDVSACSQERRPA